MHVEISIDFEQWVQLGQRKLYLRATSNMLLLLTVLTLIFALEASKVVMQYVAAVSGKGWEVDRVKEQLLQSNPVLEGK